MMQIFEGQSWAYSIANRADANGCANGCTSANVGEGRQYLLNVHPQPLGARAVSDLWHERQVFFTHSYVFNLHMPGRCYL